MNRFWSLVKHLDNKFYINTRNVRSANSLKNKIKTIKKIELSTAQREAIESIWGGV